MTKKYKNLKNLFFICSILAVVLPLVTYSVKALIEGQPTEKFTMSCLLVVSLLLCIANIALKIHLRSTIWILLLGIHACLENLTTLLVFLAIATILDELVFTPLYKKYKNLYIINREIDKR